MLNTRRFEKKGLVHLRGYQMHDKYSPFRNGYVLTWIEQNKPKEGAVLEAFERTNSIIVEKTTADIVLERVRMIRDQLVVANDLLSKYYLQSILKCTRDQVRRSLKRAMQKHKITWG